MVKKIKIFILLFIITIFSGCNGSNTTISDVINNTPFINNTQPQIPIQPQVKNTQPNINLNNNGVGYKIGSLKLKQTFNENDILDLTNNLKQYSIVSIQNLNNQYELADTTCSNSNVATFNKDFMKYTNLFNSNFNDSRYKIKISPLINNKRYMFYYDNSNVKLNSCWVSKDQNSNELCKPSTTGLLSYDTYNCEFTIDNKNLVIQNLMIENNNVNEFLGAKVMFNAELEKHSDVILSGNLYNGCSLLNSNPLSSYVQTIQPDCLSNVFIMKSNRIGLFSYFGFNGISNGISWINLK